MSKKVFISDHQNLAVCVTSKYPDYSVVGSPVDFYVYIKDTQWPNQCWSTWIKGKPKLHQMLKELHDKKDLQGFIEQVKCLHRINLKE